jgi:multiple sugar transport system permease protein
VLFSVANIGVWGGVGFNMIVLYTALRGVPGEMYDAARIDGAGEVQIALRVKVPLIMPAIVMTAIFSMIATLQVYTEPATLQPLTDTVSQTWVPLMTIYRDAFVNADLYSAAAASVVLALGTLVVSVAVLTLLQRRAFGRDR